MVEKVGKRGDGVGWEEEGKSSGTISEEPKSEEWRGKELGV